MSGQPESEAKIVRFPGISSISLSITPINQPETLEMLEAIVRVYDENDEQIMRQKARSLQTIAKNLKLLIQTRTGLPINDRRMATWFADYLTEHGIPLDSEESYQIIKKATKALDKISSVKIEHVEPSDLVSIETDVLAKLIALRTDHLFSEEELSELLEKHQCPVLNEVTRIISYQDSEGKEIKKSHKMQILPLEKIGEYALVASFKNETEKPLKNVSISDIIPYTYNVEDVTFSKAGRPKKELLEEGLKISWQIKELKPGEESKASYTFGKRIARTILIRKDEEIRIVQDYNTVNLFKDEEGNEEMHFISEAINLLPVTLDEMIIRDLIPTEMRLKQQSLTEDMKLIDFGERLGINVQTTAMNVATGTRFLNNYRLDSAPLLWKFDLKVPLEEDNSEEIMLTKIFESLPMGDRHICTIIALTPVPGTVVNPLEEGLKVTDTLPPDLSPTEKGKTMNWEIDNKLAVSMILSGELKKHPLPPKLVVKGKEYSPPAGDKPVRESRIIALPFNHIALFRKLA